MKIVIGIICVIVVYFCYILFYALVRRNDLAETVEQKMKEDSAQVQFLKEYSKKQELKRKRRKNYV